MIFPSDQEETDAQPCATSVQGNKPNLCLLQLLTVSGPNRLSAEHTASGAMGAPTLLSQSPPKQFQPKSTGPLVKRGISNSWNAVRFRCAPLRRSRRRDQ